MLMSDFQELAKATLPDMKATERLDTGVVVFNDHADELAKMYAKKRQLILSTDFVVDLEARAEAKRQLVDLIGYTLVDLVQICEGMGLSMDYVAARHIVTVIKELRRLAGLRETE